MFYAGLRARKRKKECFFMSGICKRFAEVQRNLRELLPLASARGGVCNIIGGTDVSYFSSSRGETFALGGLVLFSYPALELIHQAFAILPVKVPYIPGYLSFREIPVLLEAFEKLKLLPDLWLVDGAGIAHPQSFGLACHFGLLTGIPSVGVAKSRLIGTKDLPGPLKGDRVPLRGNDGSVLGMVVRSRREVRPLYISVGWGISLRDAVSLVLSCCTKYRLPEPTRWAHKLCAERKKRCKEERDCDY